MRPFTNKELRQLTLKHDALTEWLCPECGHEFDYGDECEHMYFDLSVQLAPLLKAEYEEGSHGS